MPGVLGRGNFDLLQFLSVAIVVYGNGLVLTSAPPAGLWGAPVARIGLDLLFATAGFLGTDSWIRCGRTATYLAHRAVRVFPGLLCCVLLTVCLIGPLATKLSLRFYFLNRMTLRYLGNAVLIPQFWLPRVFEGRQWVGTVNPMLWTLAPGIAGYLAIPVLGGLRRRRPIWAAAGCAALCAMLSLAWPVIVPHLPLPLHRQIFPDALIEMPFFFVGVALRFAAAQHGEGLWRADLAMLCFAATWVSATWLGEATIVLEWLTLPYMGLCFGRMSLPVLGRFGVLGNPSYGCYLYAFPLQQLILDRLPGLHLPILAGFAAAVPAGYLSWFLVERPALRRWKVARPYRIFLLRQATS